MIAKNRLIEANLGFVISASWEFWHPGLSILDLVSDGCMGLLVAIDKYDPDKGVRFITYAIYWIKHHLRMNIQGHHKHDHFSLDTPIRDGENNKAFIDTIVSESSTPFTAEKNSLAEKLFLKLSEREKEVIEMRYWQDLTCKEVGKKLGVSQTRVKQIEARSLRKMRWAMPDIKSQLEM